MEASLVNKMLLAHKLRQEIGDGRSSTERNSGRESDAVNSEETSGRNLRRGN